MVSHLDRQASHTSPLKGGRVVSQQMAKNFIGGLEAPDSLGKRTAQAYREVKRRIVTLELPPGAVFTEGEVAAELGLSKTPVREALARLHTESLVELAGRAGYRVVPVTLKVALDLFALRALLEPEAAALAAARGLDQAAMAALNRLAKAGRHTEVHIAVAKASANVKLAEVLEGVLHQVERVERLARTLGRSIPTPAAAKSTKDLLAALRAGDSGLARRAVEAHIESARDAVIDALLSSSSVIGAEVGPA